MKKGVCKRMFENGPSLGDEWTAEIEPCEVTFYAGGFVMYVDGGRKAIEEWSEHPDFGPHSLPQGGTLFCSGRKRHNPSPRVRPQNA